MSAAIAVEGVSKRFRLYHERPTTLKERLVSFRKARYELFWALKDVSLQIGQGETAGLIGPNGCGKTTLLKLIAGIMRPDEGVIRTRGRIASLLELGAGFHPDLTGRENVYMNASILGLSRKDTERFFDTIVEFSELSQFIDMQVRHYSSGMYVRLGFAVAMHVDPEILIVDEVLSVGDEAFQRKCLQRIKDFKSEGRTIVFVSHAVDMARALCDNVYFLLQGRLESSGNPAEVIRAFRHTIHGDAHLNTQEERSTEEVRIKKVEFLDAHGRAATTLTSGEPMEIQVTLVSEHPVEDPVVGIGFYDQEDALIYGTNTALKGVQIDRVDGSLEVTFRVDSLAIMRGQVQVSATCHSRDERTVYHWLEKKFGFGVAPAVKDHGRVHMAVTASVKD